MPRPLQLAWLHCLHSLLVTLADHQNCRRAWHGGRLQQNIPRPPWQLLLQDKYDRAVLATEKNRSQKKSLKMNCQSKSGLKLCSARSHFTYMYSHTCDFYHDVSACRSRLYGGTAAAAPPPFRPGNPALCGSRPLVTPYYCRLGNLLCFVFMSAYCMSDLSVYYLFLQYFDTVGWVF